MEREAERIVGHVVALAAVEQVLLQIIAYGEERATCRIGGDVRAVGAEGAFHSRTC